MPDVKISELPETMHITEYDDIVVVQEGQTKKIKRSKLFSTIKYFFAELVVPEEGEVPNKFKLDCGKVLATGDIFSVHFDSTATDSTITAKLSVDNGTTFYDVEGCKANALAGETFKVQFDGTKFNILTDFGYATVEVVE